MVVTINSAKGNAVVIRPFLSVCLVQVSMLQADHSQVKRVQSSIPERYILVQMETALSIHQPAGAAPVTMPSSQHLS